jgi:hypothetical protein
MNRFTSAEIEYLQNQRLGRMATVNEKGDLHVIPVGFRYNPEHDLGIDDRGEFNDLPRNRQGRALLGGRHLRSGDSCLCSFHFTTAEEDF